MAGRFIQQNENKELRNKVRRNRAGAQGMGAAKTFIVAASLAAAMGGWAPFRTRMRRRHLRPPGSPRSVSTCRA